MLHRLKSRSFTKTEIGLLALGAFLVVAALAAVGVPSIMTRHTERVERTTTQKVPVPVAPPEQTKPQPHVTKIATKREIIELRQEILKKIQTARTIVHSEVTRWCLAHDNCKGDTGPQGARGTDGADGQDGKDVPVSKTSKDELDSAVLNLVDNALSGVETAVGELLTRVNSLTGRVTLLERILVALCRVLTPGRC